MGKHMVASDVVVIYSPNFVTYTFFFFMHVFSLTPEILQCVSSDDRFFVPGPEDMALLFSSFGLLSLLSSVPPLIETAAPPAAPPNGEPWRVSEIDATLAKEACFITSIFRCLRHILRHALSHTLVNNCRHEGVLTSFVFSRYLNSY